MNSHLINVRLDSERLRKVQMLRGRGVKLSDVVREAIDERFRRLHSERQSDVKTAIRAIFEQYPDPPGLPPRTYDAHDRHSARRAVLRKLRAAS
jgi:hypothetical protein